MELILHMINRAKRVQNAKQSVGGFETVPDAEYKLYTPNPRLLIALSETCQMYTVNLHNPLHQCNFDLNKVRTCRMVQLYSQHRTEKCQGVFMFTVINYYY